LQPVDLGVEFKPVVAELDTLQIRPSRLNLQNYTFHGLVFSVVPAGNRTLQISFSLTRTAESNRITLGLILQKFGRLLPFRHGAKMMFYPCYLIPHNF